MMLKQIFIPVLCTSILTGCAEFQEVNQQVAVWAGKMIEIRDGTQSQSQTQLESKRAEIPSLDYYRKTVNSQRNIDSLFVKLKRELNLRTDEKIPGVYYQFSMAEVDPKFYPTYFTTLITLEKEGKKTTVRWKIYGTASYAKNMEQRILKAIK